MIRVRHLPGLVVVSFVSLAMLLGGCAVGSEDAETSVDDLVDLTDDDATDSTTDAEATEQTDAEETDYLGNVEDTRTAPIQATELWNRGGPYPIPWQEAKKASGTSGDGR